jgi:hypothetical protein
MKSVLQDLQGHPGRPAQRDRRGGQPERQGLLDPQERQVPPDLQAQQVQG